MIIRRQPECKLYQFGLLLSIVLSATTSMAADIPPGAPLPTQSRAPITRAPTISPITIAPTPQVTANSSSTFSDSASPSSASDTAIPSASLSDTVVPSATASDTTAPSAVASDSDAPVASLQPSSQIPGATTDVPIDSLPATLAPVTDVPSSTAPTVLETSVPSESLTVAPSLQPSEVITSTPTTVPSRAPTSVPTSAPTSAPTSSPTGVPTLSPTSNPTTRAPVSSAPTTLSPTAVQVSDRFLIRQLYVTSLMSEANSEFFQATAEEFLGDLFAQMQQPVLDVQVQVEGQKLISSSARRRMNDRTLQQKLPLEVQLAIKGKFVPVKSESSAAVDLGLLSRQFIEKEGTKFVSLLQNAENVTNSDYFKSVTDVVTVDDSGNSPSRSPVSSTSSSDTNSGLALSAIIAIAVCGGLAILLVAVLLFLRCRRQPTRHPVGNGESWAAPSVAQTTQQSTTKKPATTRPVAPSVSDSGPSYNYEENSVVYSDMQSNMGMDTLQGIDTMSYAYSLDHGIDGSVLSSNGSDYMGQSTSASTIPFEIPMVSSLGIVPAPIPAALNDVPKSDKFTRECFAPPGRLGIVIDTTVEGPVIHKVNPGSPLEGIVWPGDIIVAIDDTDTRALSANEITALMAKNMNQRRKLTILSEA